jgi:hypothetical protein
MHYRRKNAEKVEIGIFLQPLVRLNESYRMVLTHFTGLEGAFLRSA